jgi:CRP-like cAMP-binding protein
MEVMDDNNLFFNLFRLQPATDYAAGQTVFPAGAAGSTMFVVVDGEVEIRVSDTQVEIGRPGAIIGEMALIDDNPRSATVIAKTDCRLLEIDRRRFDFLVSETPYFARAVMRVMADRLRKANARAATP